VNVGQDAARPFRIDNDGERREVFEKLPHLARGQ
jgi:hypothetical protein